MYRQSSKISYLIISRYISFLDKITKHLLCSPLTGVKFKVQLQQLFCYFVSGPLSWGDIFQPPRSIIILCKLLQITFTSYGTKAYIWSLPSPMQCVYALTLISPGKIPKWTLFAFRNKWTPLYKSQTDFKQHGKWKIIGYFFLKL